MEIIPLLISTLVLGLVVYIIYSAFKNIDAYNAIPSFDEYQVANPGLVNAGKVICSKCSGKDIYLKHLGTGIPTVKFHICRTCGSTLYKSG